MKRKLSKSDAGDQARISKLLFNKSKDFIESLQTDNPTHIDVDQKPAWIDEDDTETLAFTQNANKPLLATRLKQRYETLVGTPNWANLNKKEKLDRDSDDEILRTVGHLKKERSNKLPSKLLQIKPSPKINAETGNEGPFISCIEFHPKISVALVAGNAGIVSVFSIGGDVNKKLHNFKLRTWKISSAQISPDGAQAYISSKFHHSYCIYDLVKAKTTFVQLPQIARKPKIFKLSPNAKLIATSEGYDEVYIISTVSRELVRTIKLNSNLKSLDFSHDSEKLYCYGDHGEVSVWDVISTFRALQKFYDEGCVTASVIETSSCGRLLATGSGEGIVNIYETSNITQTHATPIKTVSNLTTRITGLKFNASSEILGITSSFYPNAVKLVHIPSYHVFQNFPDQTFNLKNVDALNFSPNSGYMALGNSKGCAYLYRLKHYKNY